MQFEEVYKPVIEKVLSEFYPGIKLHRTFDLYKDRFIRYDFESELISGHKVFVELKTVNSLKWSFRDLCDGIDLLTLSEGKAMRSLPRINPHFHCFLFVVYNKHNHLAYTRIDHFTPMIKRPNIFLGKEMYWIPKEAFNYVEFEPF